MKILSVITLSVLIVAVTCQLDLPSSEYLPPESNDKSAKLAEDGYRYRIVKKLKYRHRRDVSDAPSANYLPPVEDAAASEPKPASEAPPAHKLGDNGYEYRGVRKLRYKYRHRRDVSDAPNSEYLPPAQDAAASEPEPATEPSPAHKLGNNGYEYRDVRKLRYRYRHRRDVSGALSAEYLPPGEDSAASEPELASEVPPAHKLGDNGYEYRGIRKLRYRYRHRRDVSDTPNIEYLPPAEELAASEPEPASEAPPAHKLGNNGYEYRGVRKLRYRYRHRRDVSSAPSSEYLPPTEDAAASEPEPASEAPPAHKLGNNGYEYRGVRKLRYRYRHRRDVSETPNVEYLPPAEESAASEPEPASEASPAHKLGNNGYEYRGVRKLRYRYRHRRDISSAPSSEYLPPTEDAAASEPEPSSEAPPAHKLGNNGYEYRGVRKLRYRYRHRRDVSDVPNSEYLPPVVYLPPIDSAASEPNPAHALSKDGYRYKIAKKYKLRHRRH